MILHANLQRKSKALDTLFSAVICVQILNECQALCYKTRGKMNDRWQLQDKKVHC